MSKYNVEIPIAGSIHVLVDADSEKQAIKRAWDRLNEEGESAGDVEWEFMDAITDGNVCHAPCNEVCASKVKE